MVHWGPITSFTMVKEIGHGIFGKTQNANNNVAHLGFSHPQN